MQIPRCDLTTCVREVDWGSDPLPNYSALGLKWDTESDVLRIRCRNFVNASTRREMSSELASRFDPLGVGSPFLLGRNCFCRIPHLWVSCGTRSCQGVFLNAKKKWLLSLDSLCEFKIPLNCFGNVDTPMDNVLYHLHKFCGVSNLAFVCVIYLYRLAYGLSKSWIFSWKT